MWRLGRWGRVADVMTVLPGSHMHVIAIRPSVAIPHLGGVASDCSFAPVRLLFGPLRR